ncbi:hypothetical protein ACQ4PT_047426 [Festuca glaucescens]
MLLTDSLLPHPQKAALFCSSSFRADRFPKNLYGREEIARRLDTNGRHGVNATVAATTYRGMNALHAAVGGLGKLAVCRYLVNDVGMDVNMWDTSPSKKTPLEHAVSGGNLPAVRFLLDHGADLHQENEQGATVLKLAATKGKCEIVMLVDLSSDRAGANVNGINNCLARAASEGLTEIAKCLLEAGANPNRPDECGRMPIELAAVYATREDVELLFPFTSPIPDVADWSVDGIINHAKLESMQLMDDEAVDMRKSGLKQQGDEAFEKQDYTNASVLYTKALRADPSDRKMLANRSLCWLRLGDGQKALEDAIKCKLSNKDWAEAHHRVGEALMMLKEYEKACEVLTRGLELDPENDEIDKLFWEAMKLKKN